MAAINTECEAIQAEREPIERRLNGNLRVDIRQQSKDRIVALDRRFKTLLAERLQLQRQADTLQPQLATALKAALAPTLADAADRVVDLVEQLEGALAECGEMVEALRTTGANVPEITRPRLLEMTRADALKLMEI
jgi:seryl-tRNA synthetase